MNLANLRTLSGTGAPSPTVPNHHVALPTPSPILNQSTSSSNNNALDHHTHSTDGDGDGSYNRRSHNDDNNDNNITLVSSTTSAGVAIDFNTASAASNNSIPTFAVEDVVDVASRTGPGMNKQGGSAIITKVHASGAGVDVIYTYDVKYIIGGGREKNLDQQYISLPIPDEIKAQAKKTRGDRTSAKILGQSTVSSSRPSKRCVKKRKTQERQPLSSNTPSMEVENFDTPTSYQTTAGLRTVSVDEPSDTSPDIPPTTSTTATNGIVDETEELQDPDYDDDADEETLPKEKKKKKKKGLKSCKCDEDDCPYCSPSYDSQSDTDNDGSSDYEDSASDDDGTPFKGAKKSTKTKERGVKRNRDVVDGDDAEVLIIPGLKRKYYKSLSGNTAANLPELIHSSVDGNSVDYQFLAKGKGDYVVRACGEVQTVEDDDGSTVFDTNSLSVYCSCPSFQLKQAPVKNGKLVVCKHLVAALDSVADDSKDSTAMQQPSSSTPRSKRARKSSTSTTSRATLPSKTDEELYIPKVQSHHNGPLLQQLLKDGLE